ncbi:L-lactate dehydrogenase [Ruminiclostridium sufflavum DSM 19573]|uniref:L-lactate dehydrogenase n=1 Tax=Ruminiclostridium sufflavum DSM 19573 TaxID=1121337 RepID=A0A318XPT6_9FIRM|nr:L-lactate dehydrogenase [Ruminiclostridium sufflavum]PYG89168.1 L-lactate dehydrogenase [Ruminiclostridium sufflavum DSM 19573]
MAGKGFKVAIIGCGFVGASAAFAMSINNLVSEMVLIDVNKEKAYGEALDINHGLSFVGQMNVYSGDYSDCKDCDIIVVTAGANRKPGETRLDLAKKNVSIMKDITANIMKHYNKGVILVVSNPVDILTYMVQKWSGLPANKVIGSGTVLDSSRFRNHIAGILNVDVKNVHGYIIGEHGDSQLPVWSATHIAGTKFDSYISKNNIAVDKDKIIADVKTAGGVIIKNKGATYYGIALSINRICESLLKNYNTIMPIGTVVNGPYGISDVALSVPAVVNGNGCEKILEIDLTDAELKALLYSADQVKLVLDEVKNI